MKVKIILSLFLNSICLFFLYGCQIENKNSQNTVSPTNAENAKPILTEKGVFTVELKTAPQVVKTGEKIDLFFIIKNSSGELVKDLQIVHEKPMHLLVVSDGLDEFYHEHPTMQTDGSYKASFTFPNGGVYKLYADFTPFDAPQIVQNFAPTRVSWPQFGQGSIEILP